MAKAKSGNGTQKITFSDQTKGKTTIGASHSSIKFSTMNKNKRRTYKAYRGQGRP
jgi:hypothetical protein